MSVPDINFVCLHRNSQSTLIPANEKVPLISSGNSNSHGHQIFQNQVALYCATQILEKTCEANAAGENSSFVFTVCVKSVSLYQFKLTYVVLHMAVKAFLETHFLVI